MYIRIYIYIYIYVRTYICADKVQLCEANMQIACLVAVTPTPPLFVDTFGILVLLRYVNMITYVHSCRLGKSGILVSKSAGRGSWGQAEPLPKGAELDLFSGSWPPSRWICRCFSQEHEQSRDKLQQSTLQAWKSIEKQWKVYGYGSIPMKIPFLVGWTSINPSYFDVNYRGTRFWHTAISWSIIKSNDSNEKSWKAVVHRYSLCEVRESHERHEQSKLRWKSVHQFWS